MELNRGPPAMVPYLIECSYSWRQAGRQSTPTVGASPPFVSVVQSKRGELTADYVSSRVSVYVLRHVRSGLVHTSVYVDQGKA